MHTLNETYWQSRYLTNQTGWDTGEITTPLKNYFDQVTDHGLRILIPGCGKGYEAEYLFRHGFNNVTVLDIAQTPLDLLAKRVTGFPETHLVHGDFFSHAGTYDLIIEQTFFCALEPAQREAWVSKMHELLGPGGKVVGLLFECAFEGGPPFGGNREEYRALFEPHFRLRTFETCYNSIAPRAGRELFIILEKT
jgi:SAM-dependent methyltransferase